MRWNDWNSRKIDINRVVILVVILVVRVFALFVCGLGILVSTRRDWTFGQWSFLLIFLIYVCFYFEEVSDRYIVCIGPNRGVLRDDILVAHEVIERVCFRNDVLKRVEGCPQSDHVWNL